MEKYSEDELIEHIQQQLKTDSELRNEIARAIARKRRGMIASFVVDVVHRFLGAVVGNIVERIVDWFFS